MRVESGGVGEFKVVRVGRRGIVVWEGEKVEGAVIRHDDILKGGTLAFVGASEKYDYIVDTSAAPELDQWMRTKMLPVVRKWYPKLVEMFPSEGWKAPKSITFKFDARDESPPCIYVWRCCDFRQ